MVRNATRDVDRADDRHAMLDYGFAGFRQFAVAAALGGQIENHRARRHAHDHLLSYEHRRFFARDYRGGDDNVALFDDATEEFALSLIKGFVLGSGIATSVLRILRFDRQFDETTAE